MEEKSFNDFKAENKIQKCPECGVAVQKTPKTCNYITCPSQLCEKKIVFCYLCGEKLEKSNIEAHYLDGNTYAICFNEKNRNIQTTGKQRIDEKQANKNFNIEEGCKLEDKECLKSEAKINKTSFSDENEIKKYKTEKECEHEDEECLKSESKINKTAFSDDEMKKYKFYPLIKRIFFVGLIGSIFLAKIYGSSLFGYFRRIMLKFLLKYEK